MSTPFLSAYLTVAADNSDRPADPTDPESLDTNPELIACRYEADTQTFLIWDSINEEWISISGTVASYTDGDAQDAVGTILVDSSDIDFTYVPNTSITAAIKSEAVTNAQLAHAAAWSIKLRNAGSTGDPSDAALADLTAEGSPAAGDFLVGFLASGEIRKFDIGDLPAGSSYTNEEAQDALGAMLDANDFVYTDATPLLRLASPIFPPFTTPDNTAFSDINSPTVAVNANGGVSIISPSNGVRARVKALPTPPFTITAAFLMHFYKATDQEAGILLRQSSDGKLFSLGFYSNNTAVGVGSRDYTSVTVVSATNANFDQPSAFGLVWLQLTDNNTNNILKWSYDGYTWQTLLTESRTAFITADQVGFYARTTNSNSCTATMLSWTQT